MDVPEGPLPESFSPEQEGVTTEGGTTSETLTPSRPQDGQPKDDGFGEETTKQEILVVASEEHDDMSFKKVGEDSPMKISEEERGSPPLTENTSKEEEQVEHSLTLLNEETSQEETRTPLLSKNTSIEDVRVQESLVILNEETPQEERSLSLTKKISTKQEQAEDITSLKGLQESNIISSHGDGKTEPMEDSLEGTPDLSKLEVKLGPVSNLNLEAINPVNKTAPASSDEGSPGHKIQNHETIGTNDSHHNSHSIQSADSFKEDATISRNVEGETVNPVETMSNHHEDDSTKVLDKELVRANETTGNDQTTGGEDVLPAKAMECVQTADSVKDDITTAVSEQEMVTAGPLQPPARGTHSDPEIEAAEK
ncbi:testis-specific expressed protein 55 isoform X2 [Dendrobates tinctorius]|uniref:testis-specific expressed protein 55 isoform X2 n=1 Tax=Dendrobates tinctorius TaxID=92724 RepID=UPI003CC9F865